jgi:hypothetical protein
VIPTAPISTTMMACSDTDDITAQCHLQMRPCSSSTSFSDRRVHRAEGYVAKIPRSKNGDSRDCFGFSLDDNSEHEIILSSSNLYSLHNYSPEMKEQRKRGDQAPALIDGYHCCGCFPDWWDEVEGTVKHTMMSIKQVLIAAFK